jgi:hypothetical protein
VSARCPWCGKFRSSFGRNPNQSQWDVMQNGPEYVCTPCIDARRATITEVVRALPRDRINTRAGEYDRTLEGEV